MRCVLTRLQAWKRNPIRKRNGALRLSWRSARPQVPDFLQQFSDMHLAADLRCASGSWSKGSVGLLPWKHAGETLNNTKTEVGSDGRQKFEYSQPCDSMS